MSIIAADSMLGRRAGEAGHERAVRYLVSEVQRLGLRPAGEAGSYLHAVPLLYRQPSFRSVLSIEADTLVMGTDYVLFASGRGQPRPIHGVRSIYGGVFGDSGTWIPREQATGNVVVLATPRELTLAQAFRGVLFPRATRFGEAAAVVIASLDVFPPEQRGPFASVGLDNPDDKPSSEYATTVLVTRHVAARILGAAPESLVPGTPGHIMRGGLVVDENTRITHNVLAAVPGRDARLRGQYVALGAHSDALGVARSRPLRDSGAAHAIDSVFNGADDDASGVVALLEIAEAMARRLDRPNRPILFVWHTAEEAGLIGSRWLTRRPTISLDSIVAYLNLDMVGRGEGLRDQPNPPDFLRVVGARLRSSRLSQLIDSVNVHQARPLAIDTTDADGVLCRSDQASYARMGVPVAFFTTGHHDDYHRVSDEPSAINYERLTRVTRLVNDVADALANMPEQLSRNLPLQASALCGAA